MSVEVSIELEWSGEAELPREMDSSEERVYGRATAHAGRWLSAQAEELGVTPLDAFSISIDDAEDDDGNVRDSPWFSPLEAWPRSQHVSWRTEHRRRPPRRNFQGAHWKARRSQRMSSGIDLSQTGILDPLTTKSMRSVSPCTPSSQLGRIRRREGAPRHASDKSGQLRPPRPRSHPLFAAAVRVSRISLASRPRATVAALRP